jgi:hypothetical protein
MSDEANAASGLRDVHLRCSILPRADKLAVLRSVQSST